jgi:nucleoid DNA-binding protein
MSLTKKTIIREIGQRTRLKNREVQMMLETLIEVWTEELITGGRIEIENFIVLEITTIERPAHTFWQGKPLPTESKKVTLRVSKYLKRQL